LIPELISVAYGTVTMLSWGAGDVVAKKIVGRVGYHRLLLYAYMITLPMIFALAGLFPPKPPDSLTMMGVILIAGILRFLTTLFFFKGLSVGKASIIAPLLSTSTVLAVVLSFVILHESLDILQLLCVALALVGTITLSTDFGATQGNMRSGVKYALVAVFTGGIDAVLIKIVSLGIGQIGSLVSNHLIVTFLLLISGPFFQYSGGTPRARLPAMLVVLFSLTEILGFSAFVLGASTGLVSIVVPVGSASPAVTVVLARMFLGERLIGLHKIAVVLVVAGVVLLSITSV